MNWSKGKVLNASMSCDCHYNFVIFSGGAKVWEKQTALL